MFNAVARVRSRLTTFDRDSRLVKGFALPTILIVSTVMIAVLLTAIQSSISVGEGVRSQYIDKLGTEAFESGIAMAIECYKKDGNSASWNNLRPLKPNTDCTGAEIRSCPSYSLDQGCYVMISPYGVSPAYRSKFVVTLIYYYSWVVEFEVNATVDEVRTTTGTAVNRSTYNRKVIIDPANFKVY
jgi:hypothetical protein